MPVTWRGGKKPQRFRTVADYELDRIKRAAMKALAEALKTGAIEFQDGLEAATTPTGEARAERGGFPGRHRSGNFVGSIGFDEENQLADEGDPLVEGSFGIFPEDFEEYMRDQDVGTELIPAARALYPAFLKAVAQFQGDMAKIVR